ncbi:MAG: CoA-binding protein [Deltaproteobacteria bacterium]|nr:CoA-binding protein [Deltaproteobacteria bacterium]
MATPDKPADGELKKLFQEIRTIAVVGLSDNQSKPSNRVAAYLKNKGYKIVPVNPGAEEILGEKSYPDLKSIPVPVDVVDVFRRPEFVPQVAEDAVAIGAKVLWLQEDITHEEAAKKARAAGLTVVQDACMLEEHSRLSG